MEKIYWVEKCGRKRSGEYHECEYCGKEFIRRKFSDDQWEKRQKFCSKECSSIVSRNRIEVECCWCNKKFERVKSKIKEHNFCSRECKDKAQSLDGGYTEIQPSHYGTIGISTYRRTALRNYENKCEVCGYNEHIELLQVHHIDGKRSNNDVKNLSILCPTCHWSITIGKATFGENRQYTWIG